VGFAGWGAALHVVPHTWHNAGTRARHNEVASRSVLALPVVTGVTLLVLMYITT
jgi:hypothetical protein